MISISLLASMTTFRLLGIIYLTTILFLGLQVPSYGLSRTPWGLKQVSESKEIKKANKHNRENVFTKTVEAVTSGIVKPGPRFFHHALYWITAFDAVQSVFFNEYASIMTLSSSTTKPSMYSKLFYFARLRPRLLFSVGALLRALQLCTPFQKVIDPSIGVGAGVNLFSLLAGSRWVQPLILGWATTKFFWTWLGAKQLDRAFVPITLSIHEWEERQTKKKNRKTEPDPSQ